MVLSFCAILYFAQPFSNNTVLAQEGSAEIVDIQDRYILLNWSIPDNASFNSFRIDYTNETGFNHTWSVIFLNQTFAEHLYQSQHL